MGFSRRLLAPGEEVVLDVRPHWSFVAGPTALLSASVSALVLAAAVGVPDVALIALAGAAVAALGWFVARYIRWSTSSFIVTTHRLVMRRGVAVRRAEEMPLERVSSVEVVRSLRQRLVGSGSVIVHASGDRGRRRVGDVPRPGRVCDQIDRLLDEVDEQRRRTASMAPAEQLERLDALRRRGVISDEEFDAEKQRLLGRP